MKNKCDCYVLDPLTHRKRKCKLGPKFNFDKTYCRVHAKKFLQPYALIIQKHYARFLITRKLKNLFFPLPRDLQRRVLFYMREPSLLKKYHHSPIVKVLSNRVNIMMKTPLFKFFVNNQLDGVNEKTIILSFTENLKLITKYFDILYDGEFKEYLQLNDSLRKLWYRRISRSSENYNDWTCFYDVLRNYYKVASNTDMCIYRSDPQYPETYII